MIDTPEKLIGSRSISAIRWLVPNSDVLALSTVLVYMPELQSGEVQLLKTDWIPTTKQAP